MGCERHEADLTLAAIGRPVSPGLERHLAECVACRSRLEGERELMERADRGLRDALRVEPSPGFEARLLVAARRARRAPSTLSWPLRLSAAMMAAGLGFLLVWGWFAGPSPRPAPLARGAAAVAPVAPLPGPRESAPEPRVAVGETPRTAALPSRRVIRPAPSSREPEVLLPPGREQALVQFVSMLRDPRVEPPKGLTDVADPETPLPDPAPLEILDLEPKALFEAVELDGRSES